MTADQKALSAEADAIRERLAAAAKNPAELDALTRQFGERLAHIETRLSPEPVQRAALSKTTG